MKSIWVIRLCIFCALIVAPFISSFASDDFYLYQDINNDQKFEHRIHFKGDLMRELSKYEKASTIDACSSTVDLYIEDIDCYNRPPCPINSDCEWNGSKAVALFWNPSACACFPQQTKQGEQGYVYMATNQGTLYRQIPMTAVEFNNFLFSNFQVVQDQLEEQRCDDGFTVYYQWWCGSTWYCPSGSCKKNPDAYVNQIIALKPLCECYYYTPEIPAFSQWGYMCLVVMLIATTVFILLRKQKAST